MCNLKVLLKCCQIPIRRSGHCPKFQALRKSLQRIDFRHFFLQAIGSRRRARGNDSGYTWKGPKGLQAKGLYITSGCDTSCYVLNHIVFGPLPNGPLPNGPLVPSDICKRLTGVGREASWNCRREKDHVCNMAATKHT